MVTLVFTLCCLALSQQQDVELSPQERASAVHEAARLLESEYVFPDEGKKMATAITGHLDKGDYDKVVGAKAFAERLTSDMQTVFGDRHLSVDFWEHRIEMPSGGPSEQWKESRAKLLRHHNAAVVRAERLDGNVGYIKIDGFYGADVAARPINAAMAFVAETDALVIDLRDNGGGVNESVQLLASYFFSEPTEISRYYDRPTDTTRQFWTMPSLPGARYLDKPVTLLVGPETASAAEAFAYAMQTLKRATLVGKPTWGGAHGATTHKIHDHLMLVLPDGRSYNPVTGKDWEGTGVQPDVDCPVADARDAAYRTALESLYKAATDADRKRELETALSKLKQSRQGAGG